jgi:hypothetical protein
MQLANIETRIYEIRGQKVMPGFDLSEMCEVENRILKQAVKRNPDRFLNCDKLPEGANIAPLPLLLLQSRERHGIKRFEK